MAGELRGGRHRFVGAKPDVVEHVAEHDLVAQVLARDLAGGAAMAGRVAPRPRSTASAASSRSENANSPSPVGSAAPNPVSWRITGRPAAR